MLPSPERESGVSRCRQLSAVSSQPSAFSSLVTNAVALTNAVILSKDVFAMAGASESKDPYSGVNSTVCYAQTTNHRFASASGAKDDSPRFQRWVGVKKRVEFPGGDTGLCLGICPALAKTRLERGTQVYGEALGWGTRRCLRAGE